MTSYQQAPVFRTEGTIKIPMGYDGETNIIIPDEIVDHCIDRFGLLSIPVLDPMCGVSTIPRVITQRGGSCVGVEVNQERFKIAQEATGLERYYWAILEKFR